MLKVEKRDGSFEDYNRNKILNSLIRVGASPDEAIEMGRYIESWLPTLKSDVVKSSDIRAKIIEKLKVLNPIAAEGFEIYKKAEARQESTS